MLKRVMPSVVKLETTGDIPILHRNADAQNQDDEDNNDKEKERRERAPRFGSRKFTNVGSGVIVDAEKGYVLTNAHVIKFATQITVTLNNRHTYTAKVIGADAGTDIALIQIKPENLTQFSLANSDNIEVGDYVAAIGSPFGRLSQSVTSGIISALGRGNLSIEDYGDFIQTDAPINPGNSGGALVNMKGQLIGINTAIFTPTGTNIGIGFAIPVNMARDVMGHLIKYGTVKRGLLGVLVQAMTPELAEAFHTKIDDGAVVTQVSPDSPADRMGLKAGDILLEVNGKKIKNHSQVRNMIGLMRVGTKVTLKVSRTGKDVTVSGHTIDPKDYAKKSEQENGLLYGMNLRNFEQHLPNLGDIKGVGIINVAESSRAWKAGIRASDIIIGLNQQATPNYTTLNKIVHDSKGPWLIRILRRQGAMYVVVR